MLEQYVQQMSHLVQLNETQKAAVGLTFGPQLILASPGSGKTTTIIMKIGYLIQCQQVSADKIIALSFSRASASDLSERYNRFFPQLPKVNFSTIHSLAFQIVRENFHKRQIKYTLIEGNELDKQKEQHAEQGTIMHEPIYNKRLLLQQIYEQTNGHRAKEEQMEELYTYISYIKNKMLPQAQWSKLSCRVKNAHMIIESYEKFKKVQPDQVLLDYDDMLTYAEQVLREDEHIRRKFQQRYAYVLTDESQDTSLIQHKIIEMFVEKHNNLCVVADDDQSIYSWRGAEPSYLLQFKQRYPRAEVMYMEQNYRSSVTIVEAANHIISRNTLRYEKKMFTENEQGIPITIKNFKHSHEEIKYISEQIQTIHNLREVAILYRNHASSILLIHELDRLGIPFYMKDADDRFFSHWVVEDILNVMRLSYSDKKLHLIEKLYMKLNAYISRDQWLWLQKEHRGESIFTLLMEYPSAPSYQRERLASIQKIIVSLKECSPVEAIQLIRHQIGYEQVLEGMCDRLGFRKEYLLGILNSLENIADGLQSLEQFAARLKQLADIQKKAKSRRGQDVVTLSTLHSAKGLEFDTVYLLDLVEGVIPSMQDDRDALLLEESTRLFYVGMTRARKQLELLSVKVWQGEQVAESRFVQAVRLHCKDPSMDGLVNGRKTLTSPPPAFNRQLEREKRLTHSLAIRNEHELTIGGRVNHHKFGKGQIVQIEDGKLQFHFDEHGTKTLLAAMCMEQGLLQRIE